MQELTLLRHALAAPCQPPAEDFPRALSEAGRAQASRLARWLNDRPETPEEILCSPAQRTRETLAPLLALRPELESCTHFIPQLYGASAWTLKRLLDGAFAGNDRILVVGHNPGLERLAVDVLAPAEQGRLKHLSSGTLLVIGFASGWPADAGRGTVRQLVRGEDL